MRLMIPQDLRRMIASRPLVVLAVALVAGIVAADTWAPSVWAPALVAAAGALAALAARSPSGAVAGLILGTIGVGALLHTLTLTPPGNDISLLAGSRDAVVSGRIVDSVFHSDWRSRYVVEAQQVITREGHTRRVSGRASVEVRSGGRQLTPGMKAVFRQADIERLPAPTNWHQVDRRRMAARRGIHATVQAQRVEAAPGRGGWRERLGAATTGGRAWMVRTLEASMPGPNSRDDALLLASMVFGETAVRIDDEMRELFRRTGTIHLLVVSGAQVSIIVVFVMTLSRSRGRLLWWHVVILAPLLAAFSLVVVWEPSIGRALVMAALWMVAMAAGRQHDLASAVALSLIVLALVDTSVVYHIGAQLTYAATAGVAALIPRRPPAFAPSGVRYSVLCAGLGTAGAWLFITPLLMHHFHNFAFLGSVANLVGVPLAGAIVVIGLLAVILGGVSTFLGAVLCWAAQKMVTTIVVTNQLCDRLPLSFIDHVHLPAWGVALWGLAGAAAVYIVRTGRARDWWLNSRPALVTGLAVAAVGVLVAVVAWELWPRPARIVTLDVGEGQCTILTTPERRVIMVDAGGRGKLSAYELSRDVLVPFLVRSGHRRVDALIITHPHTDHYNVVPHLVRRVPIRLVLTNGDDAGARYLELLQALAEHGVPVKVAQAGTRLDTGSARLDVLSPPSPGSGPRFPSSANDRSLVTRGTLGGMTALLPGDVERPAMSWLMKNAGRDALDADFLQTPHHGRSSSEHEEFFRAVNPQVAVVSRHGDPWERWGHRVLRGVAGEVYSTEEAGAVAVESRRGRLRVKTYLQP